MVILLPLSEADTEPAICGVCESVMDAVGECPQCKLTGEEAARALENRLIEREQLFEDVDEFLEGEMLEE